MQNPVPHVLFAVMLGQGGWAMARLHFGLVLPRCMCFEIAGFACNLGVAVFGRHFGLTVLADSFGGALGLLVVLLRPWA